MWLLKVNLVALPNAGLRPTKISYLQNPKDKRSEIEKKKKKDRSWECFSTIPAEFWAFSGAYGRSIIGQSIVWIVMDEKHWAEAFVVLFSIFTQKVLGIICKEGARIWNGPCETHRKQDTIIRHCGTELQGKLKESVRKGLAAASGNDRYCKQTACAFIMCCITGLIMSNFSWEMSASVKYPVDASSSW